MQRLYQSAQVAVPCTVFEFFLRGHIQVHIHCFLAVTNYLNESAIVKRGQSCKAKHAMPRIAAASAQSKQAGLRYANAKACAPTFHRAT